MPIYEYRCKGCGTNYDVLHKGREVEEDIVCPSCKSTAHTRLMSAAAVSVGRSDAAEPSCSSGNCCGGACSMN